MRHGRINKRWHHRVWQSLVYIAKQYINDECSRHAAALSYSTLLAIVPVFIVCFSLVSQFKIFHGMEQQIQNFILSNFLANSASMVGKYLTEFISQTQKLSWITITSLAVVGILLLYNMIEAYNTIWHVKMHGRFQFTFIIYFIILLCMPIVLGLLMLLVSAISSLSFVHSPMVTTYVNHPLILALPYVASWVVFTLLNWVLPSCHVKLRYAMIAGLLATCFFELFKYGFVMYLRFFPTYRLIYGALAIIPIFILWVYITWLNLLTSALICRGLQVHFVDA